MPSTVNGIGTHYYGKKNLSVRTAPCHSCHRVGNLESYDTRLWFVIVFIPVIPLGRKRIIDKCPSCSRHYAAAADAYEQARQLQTSGAVERFRREPSAEAALEAHATLLGFHDHDQAGRFRETALGRYPDHAGLRAGLAAQLVRASEFDESARLYEEALALDPDLTEARVGVARRKMAQGELDEARELLDFLELPGAGGHEDLGPIDVLSTYYQNQGRHEEALDLAGHLLREIPQAGHQHTFRTFVRKSEKALGRTESILPPVEHSLRGLFRAEGSPYPAWQRRLVAGLAVAALLAAGLGVNNEYIRRHRSLHVLNATGRAVRVQVDDGPTESVSGLGRLTVPEGRHRVKLGGAVEGAQEVDLRAGYFDRWFSKPLWVVNPGGEAVLYESTVSYAESPEPARHRLIVGPSFVAFPHVDYPFEGPPASIRLKKGRAPVVKTVVRWVQNEDNGAFLATLETDRPAALTFAENRLRRHPEQSPLLGSYLQATRLPESPRVEAFLKSGLDRRPVVVLWHRAYQNAAEINGHDDGLPGLYDRFLASDPKNAALLYLRGRIDHDWDRQESFYRRAADADPEAPWPWFALAAHAESEGRWDEARLLFLKARERKIDETAVRERIHVARLATGEAQALVKEYRDQLRGHPMDPETMIFLNDALAVTGQADAIEPEVNGWLSRITAEARNQLAAPIRAIALYQAGKADECERFCRDTPILQTGALRAQALAALGRAVETTGPAFDGAWDDPWTSLAVSLDLGLGGKPEEATRYRDRACKALEKLNREYRRVAEILKAGEPPPLRDLERLSIGPEHKALLLAALGVKFPAKRAEFLARAAHFNVLRKPPYLVVRRATAAGEGPPP